MNVKFIPYINEWNENQVNRDNGMKYNSIQHVLFNMQA